MENKISLTKNTLVVLEDDKEKSKDFQYLINHFCGKVINHFSELKEALHQQVIYICGDISKLKEVNVFLYIIEEFSYNYKDLNKEQYKIITLGKVPVNIIRQKLNTRH